MKQSPYLLIYLDDTSYHFFKILHKILDGLFAGGPGSAEAQAGV